MADPFLGEIRLFAGNFAPRNWAFCNGTAISISQNAALFSLLGTIYGGDGRTNFKLPDLQGRVPRHPGSPPGLVSTNLGQSGGAEKVTLTMSQMPSHTHQLVGSTARIDEEGGSKSPDGQFTARMQANQGIYASATGATLVNMASEAVKSAGSGQAHNNMQPFLAINFIIALNGIYPPRS